MDVDSDVGLDVNLDIFNRIAHDICAQYIAQ